MNIPDQPPNSALAELQAILARWLRWFRVRQAVLWLGYGLAASLAMALVISLIAVFQGRLLEREFFLLVGGLALAGAFTAVLAALVWPFPPIKAARYFDYVFGLRERTSTALELASAGDAAPPPGSPPNDLRARQLANALDSARAVNPSQFLPLRFPWQIAALCLLLAAGTYAVWLRGESFFRLAEQLRALQQAISEEATQLEALVEEIEANPLLTDEQKEQLTQPLEQAIQELQAADTLEQAVSTLNSAKQELQALADQAVLQQAEDLQNAGEQLQQQPGSALESFGENLANGDFIAAANDLANLDVEDLTQAEEEQLAEQLEQTADAMENSNPELAEQLRAAAEAIRNGNAASAQQALQQAAQTLVNSGQQIAQAQAAQQAAEQLTQGQQQVIQAGQPQNQTAQNGQQGQGEGQGQAGQNGQGQGQGEGENGGPGEGQSSESGAGEGSAQGGAPGGEAGEEPIEQGNAPGDGGLIGFEPLGADPNIEADGEQITLPPSGQPGDNTTGQGPTDPGSAGPATVPYTQVLPAYSETAIEAVESGVVPPGYRNLIRDYFSSLEP